MKKVLLLLLIAALFTGCGAQETFETVNDILPVMPVASPQQFFVSLPDEAATPSFQDDSGGELYVCQDYTISKQVMDSGDMEKTVKTLTGQSKDSLQVMKTTYPSWDRYDFVWTAAGEDGLQVGRACVLDDGDFHYTLTTMTREETAGQLQDTLQEMFDSCKLLEPDINLHTGS